MIESNLYGIYTQFVPDEDPMVLLGVVPQKSGRFAIAGKHMVVRHPGGNEPRATVMVRLSTISDGVLDFQVVDQDSGASTDYQMKFDVLPCTCRRYDGP